MSSDTKDPMSSDTKKMSSDTKDPMSSDTKKMSSDIKDPTSSDTKKMSSDIKDRKLRTLHTFLVKKIEDNDNVEGGLILVGTLIQRVFDLEKDEVNTHVEENKAFFNYRINEISMGDMNVRRTAPIKLDETDEKGDPKETWGILSVIDARIPLKIEKFVSTFPFEVYLATAAIELSSAYSEGNTNRADLLLHKEDRRYCIAIQNNKNDDTTLLDELGFKKEDWKGCWLNAWDHLRSKKEDGKIENPRDATGKNNSIQNEEKDEEDGSSLKKEDCKSDNPCASDTIEKTTRTENEKRDEGGSKGDKGGSKGDNPSTRATIEKILDQLDNTQEYGLLSPYPDVYYQDDKGHCSRFVMSFYVTNAGFHKLVAIVLPMLLVTFLAILNVMNDMAIDCSGKAEDEECTEGEEVTNHLQVTSALTLTIVFVLPQILNADSYRDKFKILTRENISIIVFFFSLILASVPRRIAAGNDAGTELAGVILMALSALLFPLFNSYIYIGIYKKIKAKAIRSAKKKHFVKDDSYKNWEEKHGLGEFFTVGEFLKNDNFNKNLYTKKKDKKRIWWNTFAEDYAEEVEVPNTSYRSTGRDSIFKY